MQNSRQKQVLFQGVYYPEKDKYTYIAINADGSFLCELQVDSAKEMGDLCREKVLDVEEAKNYNKGEYHKW